MRLFLKLGIMAFLPVLGTASFAYLQGHLDECITPDMKKAILRVGGVSSHTLGLLGIEESYPFTEPKEVTFNRFMGTGSGSTLKGIALYSNGDHAFCFVSDYSRAESQISMGYEKIKDVRGTRFRDDLDNPAGHTNGRWYLVRIDQPGTNVMVTALYEGRNTWAQNLTGSNGTYNTTVVSLERFYDVSESYPKEMHVEWLTPEMQAKPKKKKSKPLIDRLVSCPGMLIPIGILAAIVGCLYFLDQCTGKKEDQPDDAPAPKQEAV